MNYRLLGRSGLRVSELCLGTMTFGEAWGFGEGVEESHRVFKTFVDQGGNFIDTAINYQNGASEEMVGKFVAGERNRYVIATKYTLSTNPADPNASGNHRKNLMRCVEASLRRMNTDYIDLLWVHAWDKITPVEEVMRGLDDVVRAGKVHYIGVSDTPAWVVSQANTLAELRGWTRFVGLQIEYSLIERTPERDLLPMARALDIAVTPWGAVGGGLLTGKYRRGQEVPDSKRKDFNNFRLNDRNFAIADEVAAVAAELGKSASQVALNWVRQQPGVVIPIAGARTGKQIEDNLACLSFMLSPEHLERLNKASAITLGFPHDFLSWPYVQELVNGKTVIHDHRKIS
ncbi:MAG: Aldo-keto reductase YhdN [Myxococcota bacterium]|nr:Aldo-keto reductase YhdN [Myxococcota bacterium]